LELGIRSYSRRFANPGPEEEGRDEPFEQLHRGQVPKRNPELFGEKRTVTPKKRL